MLLRVAALVIVATVVVMSESESDYEFPAMCICGPTEDVAAGRSSFNPAMHMNISDDVESEHEAEPCRSSMTPEVNSSRRGQHSRLTAAKKLSHADQAQRYFLDISDRGLAGACKLDCDFACENILGRNKMFECLEKSYGTTSWISNADLKVTARYLTHSRVINLVMLSNAHRVLALPLTHRRLRNGSMRCHMAKRCHSWMAKLVDGARQNRREIPETCGPHFLTASSLSLPSLNYPL